MSDLPGVAMVTGAAGGIGRATVLRLLADGFSVAALDVDSQGLRDLESSASAAGHGAAFFAVELDITDGAAVAREHARIVDRFGPVSVLVNNAGIGGTAPFLAADAAAWAGVLGVHLDGSLACIRAVLPAMLHQRFGRIINVLSDGVWHGRTTVPYTTAKGALLGLTRSLAMEVADAGVRVNAVAPGPVATAMLLDGDPAAVEAERATVPIGRFLVPDEIAASIAFLAGPGGEPYVGQVLAPNGGTV